MIAPRKKPRRGRVVDKEYLKWIHTQPCLVTGEGAVTAHHVRRFGEQKDDRRTVPLVARLHMLVCEEPGHPCVERGKRVFERHWNVDLEAAIVLYNEKYERTVMNGKT